MRYDIKKWNPVTKEYDPYEVPEYARLILYTDNMDQVVDCAGCFISMKYGDSFTSRILHNNVGFGYPVCEVCYHEEVV